jgi:uncharacterized protein YndB with AHSA1/START domain
MRISHIIIGLFLSLSALAQRGPITSRVDTVNEEYLTLVQEFTVNTSVENTWAAYTTSKGWEAWVAPLADVDLKPGGTIRTNYNKDGELGDSTTNYLTIVNYVENYFITLQAQERKEWPQFLKDDGPNLYNVITFEPAGKGSCRVISYGMGYKQTQEHANVLGYFIKANEGLLRKLITYLEQ